MGFATLAGRPFRLDPSSVMWNWSVRATDKPTVGGKVVQVLGTSLDDMIVQGSFGTGGWREQIAFLDRYKKLADQQVHRGMVQGAGDPFRFTYPPQGWDFLVYLKSWKQPGTPGSVRWSPRDFAPRWEITMFVVEENAGLKRVVMDEFMRRLAQGIGWKPNQFNDPHGVSQKLTGVTTGTFGVGDVPLAVRE